MLISQELLATILSFIIAITGYGVKLYISLQKEKSARILAVNDKTRIEKKYQSSSLQIDLKDLNQIKDIVYDILKATQVDRFLMLSSVNGKDPVNHVSVLYEQHKGEETFQLSVGASSKYVDISTDSHYKSMLRSIETVTPYSTRTKDMPNGMLKDIYTSEKVLYSYVIFTKRLSIDALNDRLIYCSWASHSKESLPSHLKIRIQSANNRIKNILSN